MLTYSVTGLPPGLSISAVTGVISGTVLSTFADHGPYAVTAFATDTAGNAGMREFRLDGL